MRTSLQIIVDDASPSVVWTFSCVAEFWRKQSFEGKDSVLKQSARCRNGPSSFFRMFVEGEIYTQLVSRCHCFVTPSQWVSRFKREGSSVLMSNTRSFDQCRKRRILEWKTMVKKGVFLAGQTVSCLNEYARIPRHDLVSTVTPCKRSKTGMVRWFQQNLSLFRSTCSKNGRKCTK